MDQNPLSPSSSPEVPHFSRHPYLPFLLICLVIITGITALWWYYTTQRPDYQKIFASALELHMSAPYIRQQYTIDSVQIHETIDALSDFSNPARPITSINYAIKTGDKEMKVEQIATRDFSDYGKVLSDSTGTSGVIGVWQHSNSSADAVRYDPFNVGGSINTTFGEFLTGNYTSKQRAQLLALYDTTHAITFNSNEVKAGDLNGKPVYRFPVVVHEAGDTSVNALAAKLLGIPASYVQSADENIVVIISKQTNQIIGTASSSEGQTTKTKMSYPKAAIIKIPNT